MTEVHELIREVQATGATIKADGIDLIIGPASKVPSDLKTRLRASKSEVLAYLSQQSSDSVPDAIEGYWEWVLERAAIIECESGIDRETANQRAFELWFRRFIGGGALRPW